MIEKGRMHTRTGSPLGSEFFIEMLEALSGHL